MVKGIGHIALTVEDMKKSLHFYCDVLGFKRAFELADDEGNPWIVYLKVKDGQFIELFYGGKKNDAPNPDAAGVSHICLEVEDIYETARWLEKSGVELDVKPKQGKDYNFQCWAKDPDGNKIEFMQLDPRSPQCNC